MNDDLDSQGDIVLKFKDFKYLNQLKIFWEGITWGNFFSPTLLSPNVFNMHAFQPPYI
jgi:hypothetical protein